MSLGFGLPGPTVDAARAAPSAAGAARPHAPAPMTRALRPITQAFAGQGRAAPAPRAPNPPGPRPASDTTPPRGPFADSLQKDPR